MPLKLLGDTALQALIQTIEAKLSTKVDKEENKGLSERNFTGALFNKLESIEAGAERNIVRQIRLDNKDVEISDEGVARIILPEFGLPDGLKSGYVTTGADPSYTIGNKVTIEGEHNVGSSVCVHVEGTYNTIDFQALSAHAEGSQNSIGSNSIYAHVEGFRNTIGNYCNATHVEGQECEVSQNIRYAHAQNLGTTVGCEAGTAIGRWNVLETDKALIIGNGQSGTQRSNALTVDWHGNLTCGTINGVSTSKIVTSDNIEAIIAALPSVDGVLY